MVKRPSVDINGRRRSSVLAHFEKNLDTCIELGSNTVEPGVVPYNTKVVLTKILQVNHHCLFLSAYLVVTGLATVGVVYSQKDEAKFPDYYGDFNIIGIPLLGLGLFFFWFKMRGIVARLNKQIDAHRLKQLTEPDVPFPGVAWKPWRMYLATFPTWLNAPGTAGLIALQAQSLLKAVTRYYEPADPHHETVEVDQAMIILLSFVVVGAVAMLVSQVHGTYYVTLLLGFMHCPKRCNCKSGPKFYPLAIFQTPDDVKPVYLL